MVQAGLLQETPNTTKATIFPQNEALPSTTRLREYRFVPKDSPGVDVSRMETFSRSVLTCVCYSMPETPIPLLHNQDGSSRPL